MNKDELFLVLEALKGALTEFDALITDDIHFPSGRLIEQIEDAQELVQDEYDNADQQ